MDINQCIVCEVHGGHDNCVIHYGWLWCQCWPWCSDICEVLDDLDDYDIRDALYTVMFFKSPMAYTVRPMSRMRLTSLQKCNRARWRMLFRPTVLTFEFCDPLTFGQMCFPVPLELLLDVMRLIVVFHHDWSRETPPHPNAPLFLFPPKYCELLRSARYFYGLNTF
jgi:hypothetical protein